MIHGVDIQSRKKMCNEQGCVYEIMQADDVFFEQFGNVYISSIIPGVVKGWNIHTRTDTNIVCIAGNVKFVLYDRRKDSSTEGAVQEITIGRDNYNLVHIPYGVAFSWKNLGSDEALVANCATRVYDAEESLKIDVKSKEIPYQWQ